MVGAAVVHHDHLVVVGELAGGHVGHEGEARDGPGVVVGGEEDAEAGLLVGSRPCAPRGELEEQATLACASREGSTLARPASPPRPPRAATSPRPARPPGRRPRAQAPRLVAQGHPVEARRRGARPSARRSPAARAAARRPPGPPSPDRSSRLSTSRPGPSARSSRAPALGAHHLGSRARAPRSGHRPRPRGLRRASGAPPAAGRSRPSARERFAHRARRREAPAAWSTTRARPGAPRTSKSRTLGGAPISAGGAESREVGGDQREPARARAVGHPGPVQEEPAGAGAPLQPEAVDQVAAAAGRARPGSGGRRSRRPASRKLESDPRARVAHERAHVARSMAHSAVSMPGAQREGELAARGQAHARPRRRRSPWGTPTASAIQVATRTSVAKASGRGSRRGRPAPTGRSSSSPRPWASARPDEVGGGRLHEADAQAARGAPAIARKNAPGSTPAALMPGEGHAGAPRDEGIVALRRTSAPRPPRGSPKPRSRASVRAASARTRVSMRSPRRGPGRDPPPPGPGCRRTARSGWAAPAQTPAPVGCSRKETVRGSRKRPARTSGRA